MYNETVQYDDWDYTHQVYQIAFIYIVSIMVIGYILNIICY